MKNESLEIRQEIERLKSRLREISDDCLKDEDPLFVCTSSFCGHDEILDNLRSWCKQMGANSRCVVAGYKNNNNSKTPIWYSTTIEPDKLPEFTKDKDEMVSFYKEIISLEGLNILELLTFHTYTRESLAQALNINSTLLQSTLDNLLNNDLISIKENTISLTADGWQMYSVLGHLYHNHRGKAPVEKALFLVNLIRDKLNIQVCAKINSTLDEFMKLLDANQILSIAKDNTITDRQIYQILTGYYEFEK